MIAMGIAMAVAMAPIVMLGDTAVCKTRGRSKNRKQDKGGCRSLPNPPFRGSP